MKRNDYIVIQAPMVTDLKLKGNRLIVYALIFGFCKDGEHEFKGSLNYICEWTNLTRNAVIDTLKSLINDGLIVKREYKTNNVKFCAYSLGSEKNALPVKKGNRGSEESTLRGSVKSTPNIDNIDNNIDIDIKVKEYKYSSKKDEHSIANVNSNNDDAKFIEEIYAMYPAKCPVRNTYLGKSFKDKNRIKTLLKQYSKDEIRKVVKYEVESKQGKTMLKNFSTFLNNFPDPNTLLNEQKTLFDDSNSNANPNDEMVINGQTYR